MLQHRWISSRVALTAVLASSVLALAGCGGGDNIAQRYKVTGNVTYNGKAVESGTVTFIPDAATGRSATGSIKNGSYTLTTQSADDGALPGTYKVTISSVEEDLTEAVEEAEKQSGVKGTVTDQVTVSKAAKKSLTPEKYANFTTTDLKAEVKAQPNSINFDLKD